MIWAKWCVSEPGKPGREHFDRRLRRASERGNQVKLVLAIAAGGAIGAVARHFVNLQVSALLGTAFPWGILTVNVAGSFLMGVLVEVGALAWQPGVALRAMLTVGLLGAFTTFSTFSVETLNLMESGQLGKAILNVLASVVVCIAAAGIGILLARQL